MSVATKSRSFDHHIQGFVLCAVRKEYFLGRADASCSRDSLEDSERRSAAIKMEDDAELACRPGKSSEAPNVVYLIRQ